MKSVFRVFAGTLFLTQLFVLPCVFADGAFRYTDDAQPDENSEYRDENGDVIKDQDYEAELQRQAEELQKNASTPFGRANTNFGSAKPKMLEMKTINSQFSGNSEKTEESEEKSTAPATSDSAAAKEKNAVPAAAPAKPEISKPRVFVS